MDPRDLRKKELKELEEMRRKLKDAIVDAYMEMRTGQEDDVRKPRRMRKEYAVLCTVISEKTDKEKMDKLKQGKEND